MQPHERIRITGDSYWDNVLTDTCYFLTFVIFLGFGISVISLFVDQWEHLSVARRTRHGGPRRNKQVLCFLILSFVSLIIVNWLKFEHMRNQLASLEQIRTWVKDHSKAVNVAKEPKQREMSNG